MYAMKNVLTQMKEPIKMIFFLFFFFFGFAVHYSPLSPPGSCLFMVWRVCESWIGSFKELSKCSEGNPRNPISRDVGGSFHRLLDKQLWWSMLAALDPPSLINTHFIELHLEFVTHSLFAVFTPQVRQAWQYYSDLIQVFFHSWQSFKEDITQLRLQAEED